MELQVKLKSSHAWLYTSRTPPPFSNGENRRPIGFYALRGVSAASTGGARSVHELVSWTFGGQGNSGVASNNLFAYDAYNNRPTARPRSIRRRRRADLAWALRMIVATIAW